MYYISVLLKSGKLNALSLNRSSTILRTGHFFCAGVTGVCGLFFLFEKNPLWARSSFSVIGVRFYRF